MTDFLLKIILTLLKRKPKPICHHLKWHFGIVPQKYPVIQAVFPSYRQGCVSLALQQYLSSKTRRFSILGINATDTNMSLSDFIHPDSFSQQTEGPVQYNDVETSDKNNISCPELALYLVREQGRNLAIFVKHNRGEEEFVVEVMAKQREFSEQFLADLRRLTDAHSIYKGKVITMQRSHNYNGDITVSFQNLPRIERKQLILPNEVMDGLEHHTVRFSHHSKHLLARGRHLKRGLLLYGPPGTGKSYSIMYLLGIMKERTAILLNGSACSALLEDACELARTLAPSTVVIDDADLIAEERTRRQGNQVLFELLNQMDGIADDADVLFLLTTNRPEALEPALASRPGRIDQALLIPLPDRACRTRLFELYSQGLPVAVKDMQKFVDQTADMSAAFIRELLRKATLLALEEGVQVKIQDRHLERAVRLMLAGNGLSGKLLGNQTLPLA